MLWGTCYNDEVQQLRRFPGTTCNRKPLIAVGIFESTDFRVKGNPYVAVICKKSQQHPNQTDRTKREYTKATKIEMSTADKRIQLMLPSPTRIDNVYSNDQSHRGGRR